MKILKYILVVSMFTGLAYSDCFVCGVVPQEWNISMAHNDYADEIKKKKKKKGKKVKNKEKGKKGGFKWKSKWKKKKAD